MSHLDAWLVLLDALWLEPGPVAAEVVRTSDGMYLKVTTQGAAEMTAYLELDSLTVNNEPARTRYFWEGPNNTRAAK